MPTDDMVWKAAGVLATWSMMFGGLFYLLIKLTIKSMLSDFLTDIDGVYVRRAECELKHGILRHDSTVRDWNAEHDAGTKVS